MPKKSKLLEKLLSKPAPTSFTIRELDALMKQCGCEKFEGGRGLGIELTQSMHDCIDNYLDYCQKIGKDPEREFKGSFNVRIKPEQHKKIALYAANEGITINQFVSRAIDDELDILEG